MSEKCVLESIKIVEKWQAFKLTKSYRVVKLKESWKSQPVLDCQNEPS